MSRRRIRFLGFLFGVALLSGWFDADSVRTASAVQKSCFTCLTWSSCGRTSGGDGVECHVDCNLEYCECWTWGLCV